MAVIPKLYTLSGLMAELNKDRRTLGQALKGVEPDGKAAGRDAWFMTTALKALSGGGKLNPQDEKARLDSARADLAELDLAVKRGELVPVSMVDAAWSDVQAQVRRWLLAVPAVTAPKILPTMAPAEIERFIREGIDDALQALSTAVVIGPDRDDGDQPGVAVADPEAPEGVQAEPEATAKRVGRRTKAA